MKAKGEHILQATQKELKKGADRIVDDAKSRVAVDTGKLRDSIHSVEKENGGVQEVIADAKNSKGVHYGYIVEHSPKHRPFLYPAVDSHLNEINAKMAEATRQA